MRTKTKSKKMKKSVKSSKRRGRPRKQAVSTKSSTLNNPPKRKRGRPRKEESIMTKNSSEKKRGRGRPKKSEIRGNMPITKSSLIMKKRGRGRPRKEETIKNNRGRAVLTKSAIENKKDKKFVLCFFDTNNHKIKGIYIDLEHASDKTGINAKDILADIENGTETSGGMWITTPVGDSINHKEIQKNAKILYKKMKKLTPGRKPIQREDALEKINSVNFNKLDDAAIKKVASIINSVQKGKKRHHMALA